MSRVIISGSTSGVGKTTVTTAVLSLLENVQPFKIGPDFIDPKFHKFITKNPSINLDAYIYNSNTLKYLLDKYSKGRDISVLEGVMGLYDGLNHELDNYSTAHLSRILGTPVILVVDGRKQATSIAAHIKGFMQLDKRVDIQGVIINRVSSGSYKYLKSAIETHLNINVLGYLPDGLFDIKERHLGLKQAEEIKDLNNKLNKLKEVAKETIDIEGIKQIASKALPLTNIKEIDKDIKNIFKGKRIAIAKDEAFSFLYQSHLDLFKLSGMEVIYFSPIHDKLLPKSDIYLFPGGYPELYLDKLSSNKSMIDSIKDAVRNSKKIFAECGGFIYLSKGIIVNNTFHSLVGIYDIEIEMLDRLDISRFGYVSIESDNEIIKGHEFHYSKILKTNEKNTIYNITNKGYKCGYIVNNTIAGYPHILYYSNLEYFKKIMK